MHKHHIDPKHAGGDPEGPRVELTVEEHAEAHRQLWLKEGREYDRIAWLALSGQIGKEEARIAAVKYHNCYRKDYSKPKSIKWKQSRSENTKGKNNLNSDGHVREVKTVFEGVEYKSRSEASRKTGASRWLIRKGQRARKPYTIQSR